MANPLIDTVEGSTEPETFILETDGAPEDLTDYAAIAIKIYDRDGQLVQSPGSIVFHDDRITGKVIFTQTAGKLLNSGSMYSLRCLATDGAGNVIVFPKGPAPLWIVRKP